MPAAKDQIVVDPCTAPKPENPSQELMIRFSYLLPLVITIVPAAIKFGQILPKCYLHDESFLANFDNNDYADDLTSLFSKIILQNKGAELPSFSTFLDESAQLYCKHYTGGLQSNAELANHLYGLLTLSPSYQVLQNTLSESYLDNLTALNLARNVQH